MRKNGRIEIELFIVLITIVVTSAVMLLLVKSGAIEVREEAVAEPILNTEFLPSGREGFLAVKDFAFCNYVDADLNCLSRQNEFGKTENVYVWFVVESSVIDGQIMLLRNHKITDPLGKVVLQNEQKNAYNFELQSSKHAEKAVFADFFVMEEDAVPGEYNLDVIVENPLLNKKVTLTRKFTIVEEGLIG
ncbi:MAG: hypothetical protein AABX31_01005 [Nanoarchaeota archaeon]